LTLYLLTYLLTGCVLDDRRGLSSAQKTAEQFSRRSSQAESFGGGAARFPAGRRSAAGGGRSESDASADVGLSQRHQTPQLRRVYRG